mmetsp:Transcript_28000/g.43680  ORF Transcript_28000/g.43680 Transcript_28000/m.43680 type:complete len:100 (-) Transcript_28000:640-939(-)
MTVKDEEIEEEEGGDDSETVCPEGITCLARPFKNDLKKRGRVKRKREKVVKGTRRTRRKRSHSRVRTRQMFPLNKQRALGKILLAEEDEENWNRLHWYK